MFQNLLFLTFFLYFKPFCAFQIGESVINFNFKNIIRNSVYTYFKTCREFLEYK